METTLVSDIEVKGFKAVPGNMPKGLRKDIYGVSELMGMLRGEKWNI